MGGSKMTRCERPGAGDTARGMLRGRRCSAASRSLRLEAGPARREVKQMWVSLPAHPCASPPVWRGGQTSGGAPGNGELGWSRWLLCSWSWEPRGGGKWTGEAEGLMQALRMGCGRCRVLLPPGPGSPAQHRAPGAPQLERQRVPITRHRHRCCLLQGTMCSPFKSGMTHNGTRVNESRSLRLRTVSVRRVGLSLGFATQDRLQKQIKTRKST